MKTGNAIDQSDIVKKSLIIALGVSLFIHLGFVASKLPGVNLSKFKQKSPQRVRLVLQESKIKRLKKTNEKKKQIVNNEKSGRNEISEDSRFLGEKNQSYDRQTVSKAIGTFKAAGKGVKTGQKVKAVAKKSSPTKAQKKQKSKVAKQIKTKGREKLSFADLALGQQKEVKEAKPSTPNIAALGIERGAEGQVGLSQNNDYVEDLPLGDMTNLNTTEFKYYGFYHRIRQQLEQYWNDNLRQEADMLYRQGRRLPSSTARMTALVVIIDSFGNVQDIHVKASSGVNEFDKAAIESFNRAGPFPNPPKGMLQNGSTEIEWGFVVKS